jgi:endonuclease/exonuclease/phosphatase family metal-dependent hydrolase
MIPYRPAAVRAVVCPTLVGICLSVAACGANEQTPGGTPATDRVGGNHSAPESAEIRVATWNVHEGFSPSALESRADDFRGFAARVRPDVLVCQEVVSPAVVAAVRDGMGLKGFHTACSNFAPDDRPDFSDFEIGVISRYPISQAIEYDLTPDGVTGRGAPIEMPILAQPKLGMPMPADIGGLRGFLWVRIDALKLTVIGVHLKSSRGADGAEDVANAVRREFVAAAVADSVAQDRRLYPDYTCIVAGDFNVGHSDPKNGNKLARDDVERKSPADDGYDDTHALLRDGLVGLRMRNLAGGLTASSFPAFPSTPIDNIYVDGPAAARFAEAVMEPETYGSDHRPIYAVLPIEGKLPTTNAAPRPAGTGTSTKPSVGPTPGAPTAGGNPGPMVVIAPEEAASHFGRRATVEFVVRNGSVINEGRLGFLNSLEDFRDSKNFTVVLNEDALSAYATAGIVDPSRHFRGKTIRVTGTIELRRGQHQITVNDPKQIEEVRK